MFVLFSRMLRRVPRQIALFVCTFFAAAQFLRQMPAVFEVPEGVLGMNSVGRPWVAQRQRPRRNRKSEAVRRMVRALLQRRSQTLSRKSRRCS